MSSHCEDFSTTIVSNYLLLSIVLEKSENVAQHSGSLSARVMSFWGDSPKGMVESAIEFAKICRKLDYHNFLFSMKVCLSTNM